MKRILLILSLSSLLLSSCGQSSYCNYGQKQPDLDGIKISVLFTTSIILDAVGDACNDNGDKIEGHILNAASIATLLAIPLVVDIQWKDAPWYFLSYVSLRISLFDPMYNLNRGLDPFYIGNTSLWDMAMQKIKAPPVAQAFGRGVFFTIGFAIPLNEIK